MIKEELVFFKEIFKKIQPCYYLQENEEIIKKYFSICYQNLKSRMQQPGNNIGISKIIFSGFLKLPMIISNRILWAFQKESERESKSRLNSFLRENEFVEGMFDLFFGSLKKLKILISKFIGLKGKETNFIKEDARLFLFHLNSATGNEISVKEIELIFSDILPNFKFYSNDEKKTNLKIKSDYFIATLYLIYKIQPFTEDVLKFFKDIYEDNKIKKTSRKISLEVDLNRELISLPNLKFLQNLSYIQRSLNLPKPRRKNATKNVLDFDKSSINLGNLELNILSEFKVHFDEKLINEKINKNEILKENDYLSTEFTSNKSLNKSLNSNDNKSTNDNKNSKFSSINAFQVFNSNSCNYLQLINIFIIDNNLLILKENKHNKKLNVEKIIPLSGCLIHSSEKVTIKNQTFFPITILSKFTNSLSSIDNTILFSSEYDYKIVLSNLKEKTNYKNIEDLYDIETNLSESTFATVYSGVDKFTQEKVAIKVILKDDINNEELNEMIKNEIDVMNLFKLLKNDNIVTPIEVLEDKFYIYLVMEYLEGGSLEDYFSKRIFISKKFRDDEIIMILKNLAEGIKFLHKFGIIHRDIKMENVMLNKSDNLKSLKLVDFGFCILKLYNEKCEGTCGTVLYSAPELLSEKNYNNSVDIWSLGVLIFRLLTGKFPFDGKTVKEIICKILNDELSFSLENDFNIKLLNIVLSCLMKNHDNRLDINQLNDQIHNL